MVDEGLISREEAVVADRPGAARPAPASDDRPGRGARGRSRKGLNASPGRGERRRSSSTPTRPRSAAKAGEPVILVRWETTPDDIHGMIAAQGILTAHGGMTSHAAVVARGMGKPCVAGCEGADDRRGGEIARLGGHELREGDVITIDGGTGRVYRRRGRRSCRRRSTRTSRRCSAGPTSSGGCEVRANADTPDDAAKAREFGAEGIGLCRTEHMFFGEERLPVVQEMILAPRRGGPPRRARPAAAVPAGRLRGDLRGDGRAAGDDPAARPAAARVPAVARGGRRPTSAMRAADPRAARVEPDARHARLPARALLPGDLRDAGARDRARRERGRRSARARRRSSRSCTRSSASPRSCAGCAS